MSKKPRPSKPGPGKGKSKIIRSEVEGRKRRNRERRYQRRYARLHGYFWLPCPICGDNFGGHEAHGHIPDPTSLDGSCKGICPDCTAERQTMAETALARLGEQTSVSTSRWGFPSCIWHDIPGGGRTTDTLEVHLS